MGSGSTRSCGSGGSVMTSVAEESPRCICAAAGAVKGVVSLFVVSTVAPGWEGER